MSMNRINKILIIIGVISLASIIIEILFVHPHVLYWWHGFLGFDLIYGFIGCTAIIVVSKLAGKAFIQRKEDYYDGGDKSND